MIVTLLSYTRRYHARNSVLPKREIESEEALGSLMTQDRNVREHMHCRE